jgi:tRNA G18 (ribose-2'-O)-methylase SpoU
MLLVVGNELAGVDPAILDLSDRIVSIPMMGHKSSLNAAVAFGIVVYWLQYGIGPRIL